ncbi:response regulator receiver protein [Pirellula staleyi DSM 6068]|uniref:Response regulator receiver protein n=1 Tax=Pirellula staleyi (strain ATCC 27377 / DSM 6068 / ICPB 4128) TaxID=530564 RepID=D2R0F8_PIRSD|nr:P-loop NTPase [Pirellula staleyi]ADB14826.1 response regulator receiver protein [Pirellula staleyi DSM 6068]
MLALVAGHDDLLASRIATRLSKAGIECPRASCVPLEQARALLHAGMNPDLLFLNCNSPTDRVDDLIHRYRETTGGSGTVVAIGKGLGMTRILELIRTGASDYLDAGGDLDAELDALIARLRMSSQGRGKGQAICVLSASGGSGASSIAANLAISLAKQRGSACLIDLKLRGGDLATLMNLKPRHTIVDLCFQGERLDHAMFDSALLPHPSGVKLLAAPTLLTDHAGVDVETISQVFKLAATDFPYVVLDLEDVVHREQQRAIASSDLLIVVLRLDFPCILRTRRMLAYLREMQIDPSRIRVVANRFGNSTELPQRKAQEALGMPIFHALPEDSEAMLAAVNLGNPAVLERPASKVSKAMQKLADMITA